MTELVINLRHTLAGSEVSVFDTKQFIQLLFVHVSSLQNARTLRLKQISETQSSRSSDGQEPNMVET